MSTRSAEVRDALVDTLLKAMRDGVPVRDAEGVVHIAPAPAALLSVAQAYVKAFPPNDLPKAQSPTGVLKSFMDSTVLPFTPTVKAN